MNVRKQIKKFIPNNLKKKLRLYNNRKQILKKYKGSNVYCIICNSKFDSFAPFGIIERTNALCPNCNSLERHRLLWRFLKKETNLISNKKIKLLHFAPEKVFINQFANFKNIEYFPCDLQPELYGNKQKVKILKADITNIPFKDNTFDVILCNHVLEHIEDEKLAMSELFRVMKINGWGIFQVPLNPKLKYTYEDFSIVKPEDRVKAFGQSDHVRIYGLDYKDRLKNAGFDVTINDFVNDFTQDEIAKYGFQPNELIYYCEKKLECNSDPV